MLMAGRNIHLVVLGGSRAFGTAFPDCDWDYYGLYGEPLERLLSVTPPRKDSYQVAMGDMDLTFHEVAKFLRLALKGNPTVLEIVFAPDEFVVYEDNVGRLLRGISGAFLSKRVLRSYLGYANEQIQRFDHAKPVHSRKGAPDAKFLSHAVRLLYGGLHLARTGKFMVKLDEVGLALVNEAKRGAATPADVMMKVRALRDSLVSELDAGPQVPEEPNVRLAEEFLWWYRMQGWRLV